MKRIRMWLRQMSLTQQLVTIVFMFVIILVMFVFVFMMNAADEFAAREMYRILHISQAQMTAILERSPETVSAVAEVNTSVTEVVYDPQTNQFSVLSGSTLNNAMLEDIRINAAMGIAEQDRTYMTRNAKKEEQRYYYSMKELSDGRYVITIMADEYRREFQDSLVQAFVSIDVLFVSTLFLFLMLWVSSLIIPLAQIKNYITKLKNDDPNAALNVHRNDEIGEVADALQEMAEELARENRQKQEMIQNISHDLKTPIATIRSYGESIKDGIYPYDTLEKSVDVIIEHADRLEKKVKSLIVLNKMGYLLDEGAEGDHLNMNEIIDKVILSLKVIRPEMDFIREMPETVFFHGDEEPWRITVENLIDNALRYAKTYIRITLQKDELCVYNDGIPISEDLMEALFRPYEKGSNGQFGLGLSIVHQVVTTYGYRVAAENTTDGVCFRIWRDSVKKAKKEKVKR